MSYDTAEQCWTKLAAIKQPLITRCERYAQLTIPKICLPDGYDAMATDETHDYQSIGAQATNHLTNRAMLALFAPSRPFFRVGVKTGSRTEKDLQAIGMSPQQLNPILAALEREGVSLLDQRGQRPKLYSIIRHLIVTGNVLMVLEKESIRCMGIKYYCVKRDGLGKLYTLVIRECMKFDELEQDVKDELPNKYNDDSTVYLYKEIQRNDAGDYLLTQSVDMHKLPKKFDGKWPADKLPYRVLTWDLADESDYGTGLVEEYAGDLEALSVLSEAVVDGAVLGSEFRWLVNPTGMTDADTLAKSANGSALAGKPEDIAPTQGGNPVAIQVADEILQRYEKRISTGFLMQSGTTRNAERVTAEEIRLTAQELETSFGGVYSALAISLQGPTAQWLMDGIGAQIAGTDLKISIITGLDALSRNGDLENLRQALADLGGTLNLPEQLLGRIKFEPLAQFVGDGRSIDLRPFLMSDQEYQAQQQQIAQQQTAQEVASATGQAHGQAQAEQGQPQ